MYYHKHSHDGLHNSMVRWLDLSHDRHFGGKSRGDDVSIVVSPPNRPRDIWVVRHDGYGIIIDDSNWRYQSYLNQSW